MNEYKPTDAELEILSVLWENGPSTVRTVNDTLNDMLNDRKNVGYTTTLKLMQIMTDKGVLERSLDGRTHIYKPIIMEADVQQRLMKRLLDTAFRGSAKNLILQALGNHRATSEELVEIKEMIQKMEDDAQ